MAALLLSTCQCDPPGPNSHNDAGRDTGTDAAYDAIAPLPDVGTDTSRDVGADALSDGGPTDPDWVPLPGLPSGCVIERAEHPERIPAFRWTDCGGGCQRAVLEPDHGTGFGEGSFDAGRGWLSVISAAPDRTKEIYAIMPIDGPPVAAWRSPALGLCTVRWGRVREGMAGAVAHWHDDPDLTHVEERVYVAPVDSLRDVTEPTVVIRAPYVGSRNFVDGLAVGATVAAAHVVFSGEMLIIHNSTIVPEPAGGSYAVEGDHVVWEATDSRHLWHWTPETHGEVYYTEPGTADLGLPFIDHGTLVWIALPQSSILTEIWTSPLSRTPTGLVARQVTADAGGGGLHSLFGDDLFLTLVEVGPDFEALIRDITDGRVRRLGIPEPGVGCGPVLYLSSTEALLQCWLIGTSPLVNYLYRVDPRTLPYVT